MEIQLLGLEKQLIPGISEIANLVNLQLTDKGIPIQVEKTESGIHIQYDGNKGIISYQESHQFFRALGLLMEGMRGGGPFEITENPVYNSLGVMIDCSRNAVLKIEAFQKIIKHLALMGYSTVQLYTEDIYEIEEYPYFGYMRGRYTGEQLKTMDQYADQFGIELVPCIQTLAHLGTALKWNAFSDIVDCNDILLIDEEKTYQLIDAMFRTMSEHISSRKINIGMDEAHMMGLGKYLDKHGYQDRSTLMLKHFGRVMEIARKYGYKPMMWSDMFFRLASGGAYYDTDSPIRQDVIDMIPDDISLVYWDYYSVDPEKYDGMLIKHKQLCDKIIFAGGAWKWMGFAPNNQFSRHVGEMAHNSCVRNGIKEVLITAWGDNGAEASIYSILPTLQLWAELCYAGNSEIRHLSERFLTCTGGNYVDFMNLDMTMLVPDNTLGSVHSINPQKYLLYQDVLCGLFDKHVIPNEYAAHFDRCTVFFEQCIARNPKWKKVFQTQHALSRLLALKCEAGINIRKAYNNNKQDILSAYCYSLLPEMKKRAEEFIKVYRAQWLEENKIFGLDVFDLRMGGMLQRIQTAIDRIDDYLLGRISELEELEEDILYFDCREQDGESKAISANLWHTIATPSVIAGV
ncbi:beta-N-acetylhexosaminidase [Neobacillus kokaensis]|uniref:N-acetyl-beta-D-glucosaminidase n=1 Tax=Neobacillus kokaensis TaxID=2759023 RepID=A0ABQ3N636_9BACI|nr:beta-N-acetylhexosaminidase [Neobacillus kokaensis]GHI00395.1 N-acetyl-beta-D-glucosaminidase [Neobacillus kokaensis]